MLSRSWDQRKPAYDFIVIGSGYGGAITAARIAQSSQNGSPSVCILERGREWPVGDFPDEFDEVLREQRSSANPLGLYELLNYRDISVIKGSGLGGTSLAKRRPRGDEVDGIRPRGTARDRRRKCRPAPPQPRRTCRGRYGGDSRLSVCARCLRPAYRSSRGVCAAASATQG